MCRLRVLRTRTLSGARLKLLMEMDRKAALHLAARIVRMMQ